MCDPLLLPLLSAASEAEVECQINNLIQVAAPIVTDIVQRKMRVSLAPQQTYESLIHFDAAGIRSDTTLAIIRKLRHITHVRETSIQNFTGYVAAVVGHTFHEYLHDQDPERARIEVQIQRCLTERSDFALWGDAESNPASGKSTRVRLCGFAEWRQQNKKLRETEKLAQLRNPSPELPRQLSPGTDLKEIPLPQLLRTIFGWLGHPIEFQDLVSAVACLRGVTKFVLQPVAQYEMEFGATSEPDHLTYPQAVAYLQGSLDEIDREIADLHIETCDRCTAVIAGLREIDSIIHADRMAQKLRKW